MKKPDSPPFSNDDWEHTADAVQEYVARLKNEHDTVKAENDLLQKRIRRWRASTQVISIFTVALFALLVVVGILFVSPYMRVMRVESDVIIPCVYRPSLIYRIQEGDSLFGISMFYDVPVEAIAQANGITEIHRIRTGREITIPASPCVDPVVVTRVAGEPLTATWVFATGYAASTQTLSAWRTQNSPSNKTATAIRGETITAQYMPPDLTRTTATPIPLNPLELTATYIIAGATASQSAYLQQTVVAETTLRAGATPTPAP